MGISHSESIIRLKAMVNEFGKEVFNYEAPKLREKMEHYNIDTVLINQIILVLECSTAKRYLLSNSQISTSDLNNMMSQISKNTGLRENSAFSVVKIMCEAADVPFVVDQGPYLTKEKRIAYAARKTSLKESSKNKLEMAEHYIKFDNSVSEGYQMLTELAEEGEPRAFYLLGKHYYDLAVSGEMTDIPYMDYLVIAAEQGIPEASVLVGDVFYKQNRIIGHDNTKAFYYYTKPGVGYFDENHKEKIKEIFGQKNKNIGVFVLEAIAIAIMITFLVIFNRGIVYDNSKLIFGIISLIMSVGVLAGSIYYNKKNKYNSIKWSICVMGLLWLFYLFFMITG